LRELIWEVFVVPYVDQLSLKFLRMNKVLLMNIIRDWHSIIRLMKVQSMLFGFEFNEPVFRRLVGDFVSDQFNSLNCVSQVLDKGAQGSLIHPGFQISNPESF
jgi:hypothetical protein